MACDTGQTPMNQKVPNIGSVLSLTVPCTIHFFSVYAYFPFPLFSSLSILCKTITVDCASLFTLLLQTVDCAHSCLMYKGLITADCGLWTLHVYKVAVTTVPTFWSLGLLPALPVAGRGLVITAQTVQPCCRLDSFWIQLQPSRVVLTARCYNLLF
jgi:hypothetical protein